MKFLVNNVKETIAFGEKIGENLKSGDIICLIGELGTGKTHLVKGIAKGLLIEDNITSPTFTIVNEYEGRLKLYHFDVYRVNDPYEIEAIGFDEYIFSDGVSIIEWANYIEELIPEEHITIEIKKIPDLNENIRSIELTCFGKENRFNYIEEIKL